MVDENKTEPTAEPSMEKKTSTGLEPNLAALLSYIMGIVTGLVFYLIEKENKYVRFHAMQSILFCVFLIAAYIVLTILSQVLGLIPVLGIVFIILIGIAFTVLGLGSLVVWIILMIKAYSGERYKLPIIGDIAERNA